MIIGLELNMYLWKRGWKEEKEEDRREREEGKEGGSQMEMVAGIYITVMQGQLKSGSDSLGGQNSGVGERPKTTSQGPTTFQGQVRKGKPSAENEHHSSEREREPHSHAVGSSCMKV